MRARVLLRKLAALDARRGALAAHGCAWVLVARAALAVPGVSLPRRRGWLDRIAARLPAPPRCTRDEAAWAITAAARRIPGTRCLEWSLALGGLFAQAGIPSELRIGVAAERGAIRAHAWIDAAGETWSWGGDTGGYRVLRPRAAQT